MDGLLATLEDTRLGKYKNNEKIESSQAKRRRATLERQKNKRQEMIDRARKFLDMDDDMSDAESVASRSDSRRRYLFKSKRYIGQLMHIVRFLEYLKFWYFILLEDKCLTTF